MPGSSRWVVLAASVVVAYLAAGVWADGYRHVVETTGAPTLYGRSTAYLLLLHSQLPLTLVAVLGAAGVAAVGLGHLVLGGTPWWLLGYLPAVWSLVRGVARPSS